MIEVTVTKERVQETLDFVKAMRLAKEKHNVEDKMFDINNTSEGINIIGHLGEQAVGQALGIPVDTTVMVGGDDGSDMVLDGMTIQVKTSQLKSLIFNAPWLFKSDIAIMVQFVGADKTRSWEDPQFKIWGYIDRETFLSNHYKKNYGYGERLVMDVPDLNPIENFLEYQKLEPYIVELSDEDIEKIRKFVLDENHPPKQFRDIGNGE
jgi:hypothetical protein